MQWNHLLLMQLNQIWEKNEKVMRTNILKEKMEKVEKEMKKEVEVNEQVEVAVVVVMGVEVKVKMITLKKMRNEMQVREIMKEVKVKRDKIPKKWWKWDVKVEQGLNAEHGQRIRRALDKCRSNMRARQAVNVIKAWKALPLRESDKAAAVKMIDKVLKLLIMFGSPTPCQPNSTPVEGASSSKRKPTAYAPSPSQQKGKKARK
ncbi:hypothetical protein Scep_025197 [Stephania cephalantha]|uniref:Uncharacterized protein n=1 Tax=Stephania cephalantha TaxID=152367 RepID=A0AAP0EQ54_9MAGN